jgi:hypothetical protein
VADACDKQKADESSAEVLSRFNALEGEDASKFYRENQKDIWKAQANLQDKAQP